MKEPNKEIKSFVLDYLKSGNATQSYMKFYDVKNEETAQSASSRLLSTVMVQEMIQANDRAVQARHDGMLDRVIKELAGIAFADMRDYVDFGPVGVSMKELADLTPEQSRVISQVESFEGENGSGSSKFKLHDKIKALDLLGKHLGAYNDKKDTAATINVFNGLTILNSSNQPKEEPQAIEVKGEEVGKSKGLQIVKAPEKGE